MAQDPDVPAAVPDDPQDPLAQLKALKAIQDASNDPLLHLKALKGVSDDPMAMYHHLYQRGLLPGLESGRTADEQSATPTPSEAVAQNVGQGLSTLASGMPGGKLALSGMRYLGDKLPGGPTETFEQAQNAVNSDVSDYQKANPKAAMALKVAGSLPAFELIPGATGAQSAAAVAGGDELLNNDPHSGAVSRITRMMVGAPLGYAGGKIADMAIAGGRALLAKGGEAAKDAVTAGRSAVANPLYTSVATAEKEPLTSEMAQMLARPDVDPIVERLKTLEQYKNMDVNDPRFLMAVRKNLSDWGKTLTKQGNVLDPGKPNMLADMKQHVGLLTDAFDKAADTQVPGFSNAVKTFAEESAPVGAQEAGYDALRRKMAGGLTSWKNIGNKTEGNFANVLGRSVPDVAGRTGQEGASGVLAGVRDAATQGGVGSAIGALRNAPSLLQTADKAGGVVLPSAIRNAILALAQSQMTK